MRLHSERFRILSSRSICAVTACISGFESGLIRFANSIRLFGRKRGTITLQNTGSVILYSVPWPSGASITALIMSELSAALGLGLRCLHTCRPISWRCSALKVGNTFVQKYSTSLHCVLPSVAPIALLHSAKDAVFMPTTLPRKGLDARRNGTEN